MTRLASGSSAIPRSARTARHLCRRTVAATISAVAHAVMVSVGSVSETKKLTEELMHISDSVTRLKMRSKGEQRWLI